MTLYLKALKQKSHYPHEMIDTVHLNESTLYMASCYTPSHNATCDNHLFSTLLEYAFAHARPPARRTSIHKLYRTLSTKTQILMGLLKSSLPHREALL